MWVEKKIKLPCGSFEISGRAAQNRTEIKDFGDPYTNRCTTTLYINEELKMNNEKCDGILFSLRWHCRKSPRKNKTVCLFFTGVV